jgi:hypothetical protein
MKHTRRYDIAAAAKGHYRDLFANAVEAVKAVTTYHNGTDGIADYNMCRVLIGEFPELYNSSFLNFSFSYCYPPVREEGDYRTLMLIDMIGLLMITEVSKLGYESLSTNEKIVAYYS